MRSLSYLLPRLGLASMVLCVISGLALGFAYRPWGNVFQNVEEITTLVPFGWFFRRMHDLSGELFVALMLAHTVEHLVRRRYRTYPFREWACLVFSLMLCFYLLFTGFILKGDKEGIFAGRILLNLLREMPFAGEKVAALFIRPGGELFWLPFLYHCILVPPAMLLLLRGHIRKWLPEAPFLLWVTVGLTLYALAVPLPPDIPPEAPARHVSGPWFFLGIQWLLRTMPPRVAGLLIPALMAGGLLMLPLLRKVRAPWGMRLEKLVYWAMLGTLGGYGLLALWAWLKGI